MEVQEQTERSAPPQQEEAQSQPEEKAVSGSDGEATAEPGDGAASEPVGEIPEPEPPPQKPVISVKCAGDGMRAEIELSRVSKDTLPPTKEDIEAALAEKGVVYGINEKYLSQLCERPFFNVPIEVAKGLPAQTGKDGYLKYLVETERGLRPKERSDGTMDYYDLGFIHNVSKGDVLCEVHSAEKGEDGCSIFGIVLEGRFGKSTETPIGKNTEFDKENSVIVAMTDGNVVVSPKGIIDVHNVLNISGNVDNSTGNIIFSGDVIIQKDVASGFKVETSGNIVVKGSVEGASLNAKGNISVNQGINGMDLAKITVGGSLKCKYIQNCHIEAGEDIYADTIMFCTIECNGNIFLAGKRGALIGGKTVIAKTLVAKSLGTDTHVPTHVTMAAVGLKHNEEILELKKAIVNLDKELISLIQTMNWCKDLSEKGKLKPFQANAYEQAKARQVAILTERPKKIKALEDAQNELLDIIPEESFIKCSSHVHTGVRIIFGMQTLNVQASFMNSRVYFADGQITVSPL